MFDWVVSIPYGQDKVTSTVRHERKLGTPGMTPDGRMFHWVFTNGAIGAGHVVSPKLPINEHDQDLQVSVAAAIGDMTLSIVIGALGIAENLFEDGSVFINDGTGEGHLYKIKSHPAGLTGATVVFTLWEPIREALLASSSSLLGLHENHYQDVVDSPSTVINAPLGVAPTEFADNTYGWVQFRGEAAVLTSGNMVVGHLVQPGGATGAVVDVDYSATSEFGTLGALIGADATGADDNMIVMLNLP